MPLRVRCRKGTAFLWLVGTIKGRRVRESTNTTDAGQAEVARAAREKELYEEAVLGIRPTVPFRRAAESYLKAKKPAVSWTYAVNRLVSVLGTRATRDIDQNDADRARDVLCKANAKNSSITRAVSGPLTAILRHAARRGWCERPDLEWPERGETEFHFLLPAQATALVANAAGHLQPLLTFLLCTGVRSGEALRLDWRDVDLEGERVMLWEGGTKTGRRRVVHLNPGALTALESVEGREGRVFRRDDGEPYEYNAWTVGNIRSGWAAACARSGLPGTPIKQKHRGKGRSFRPVHTPHDCRHTYATWHYALHKDLLLLARDVGWKSTKMAERYAHVMPAGHQAAICAFWGTPAERHDPDTAFRAPRASSSTRQRSREVASPSSATWTAA